jgi:hypothetical protein
VAVSDEVRRYYAERIFARMGSGGAPPNFRPLERPATGCWTVEGCRGGGKNMTEFRVRVEDGRVADVRVSCNLCNPAMYVAADIVVDWARGRGLEEILAPEATAPGALEPFFAALGGGRPDDAREKFQYALVGIQNAVRDHRGEPAVPPPAFEPPAGRDP